MRWERTKPEQATSKTTWDIDSHNVKSKERRDCSLATTFYPSGLTTYILSLQMRKLKLKLVKGLAPGFTAAALPGVRRHAHSSRRCLPGLHGTLLEMPLCPLGQGDQREGSAAGGIKEGDKSVISCKKTPWFDLLRQNLVMHSPCTLRLFLHESQASIYLVHLLWPS